MTTDRTALKRKIIDYYDQEAASYSDLYTLPLLEQEFYPANAVRLEIILDALRVRGVKTLLDVGCGSGHPLLRFLKHGFDAYGFDFSPKMVEQAKDSSRLSTRIHLALPWATLKIPRRFPTELLTPSRHRRVRSQSR